MYLHLYINIYICVVTCLLYPTIANGKKIAVGEIWCYPGQRGINYSVDRKNKRHS